MLPAKANVLRSDFLGRLSSARTAEEIGEITTSDCRFLASRCVKINKRRRWVCFHFLFSKKKTFLSSRFSARKQTLRFPFPVRPAGCWTRVKPCKVCCSMSFGVFLSYIIRFDSRSLQINRQSSHCAGEHVDLRLHGRIFPKISAVRSTAIQPPRRPVNQFSFETVSC